ncbi:purine-nucleoside phosphorylase [Shewanella sp. SE1]|nr:purine-nucleoside phosphorylase [Shewanella sp. SE1]
MAAHANGAKGDFAKTVIMPGDSWWANYIAEHFLDDAREVISVRNMLGYTDSWQGKPVSVMGQSKQRIRFIVSSDRVSARLWYVSGRREMRYCEWPLSVFCKHTIGFSKKREPCGSRWQ